MLYCEHGVRGKPERACLTKNLVTSLGRRLEGMARLRGGGLRRTAEPTREPRQDAGDRELP